jgi:deoxyribodipyrimidine photo-lyase
MSDDPPIILWFRRDLRLADHPGLHEAVATGRPVIPVFLNDEVVEAHGAAPKWRLGLGVAAFADRLDVAGGRLVLRRGRALDTLRALVRETGATAVWWSRLHDPEGRRRDDAVEAGLNADGVETRAFPGHVLFDPWTVETGAGGYYKVYTPYWRAVRGRGQGAALPAPRSIRPPRAWPASERIEDWGLGDAMNRGAAVVAGYVAVGEDAARARLDDFVSGRLDRYATARDQFGVSGTSQLSENLTYGEISARTCWNAAERALDAGNAGAETFLKELAWRDYAHHLVFHTPHITTESWRPEFRRFPWRGDAALPEVQAWTRGRTGVALVDAAMRELYVTGRMHNRARMVAASFLTKHLLADWRIGLKWFEDCLVDWDPASNALGWQWVAGSGPDASPFFRVFNPDGQAEKFDADGSYRRRWIAEGRQRPAAEALQFFEAIPRRWGMTPDDAPPAPIIALAGGRERALAAYERFKA